MLLLLQSYKRPPPPPHVYIYEMPSDPTPARGWIDNSDEELLLAAWMLFLRGYEAGNE